MRRINVYSILLCALVLSITGSSAKAQNFKGIDPYQRIRLVVGGIDISKAYLEVAQKKLIPPTFQQSKELVEPEYGTIKYKSEGKDYFSFDQDGYIEEILLMKHKASIQIGSLSFVLGESALERLRKEPGVSLRQMSSNSTGREYQLLGNDLSTDDTFVTIGTQGDRITSIYVLIRD